MTDIKTYKLDTAFALLKDFDFFAKPDDFIEVSLWHNGEGFDAHLSSHGDQSIRLTWGEFKALKKLIKELKKMTHPITPPSELVDQWDSECESDIDAAMHLATQAALWGADMELEACCEFEATVYSTDCADKLRRHRRPKPPSLKAQALETLKYPKDLWSEAEVDTIRSALEQLDD